LTQYSGSIIGESFLTTSRTPQVTSYSNVDRQIAIWQTLNPDNWFDQPLPGDPQPTDALQPFHIDTEGTTYNSNMIRDWKALGYQYDTLMPPLHVLDATGQLDQDSYLSHLKRHLNERYSNKEKDRPGNIDGHKNDYVINIIYDRYDKSLQYHPLFLPCLLN
jgi:tyrosinase